ncbi:Ecm30 [Kluyveromyces lactis]|nr:Ecm30 [Kluyveromyces lactis]
MGNTDSRLLVYKEHLLRLATDEIIPLYGPLTTTDSLIGAKNPAVAGMDSNGAARNAPINGKQWNGSLSPFDSFYTNLVSSELPPQYLSMYLNTRELRTILLHNKANFTNLLHFLTYSIIQYSSFPSSLKDQTSRRSLTNCLRILSKLIPIMFEQADLDGCLEADVFWSKTSWPNVISLNSAQSDISNKATVGIPDSPFNSPSANTNSSSLNSTSVNIDFKASPQDSLRVTIATQADLQDTCFLGARLLSALVQLSTQEGFARNDNIFIQSNTNVHYDIHLLDILRLLITLFSKPLYKPTQENMFLSSFLKDTESSLKLNDLVSRIIKIIVRFDPRAIDPIRKPLFIASLQFLNITMKFNSDNEQLMLLFFQNLSAKSIVDKIYLPLQDILSIIVEGDDLSNFQLCLPIFQFIFNLFLLNSETRTELATRFGAVLLTTLIIYAKVVSQERYCKPLLQFLAHFMAYLSSLPQIHSVSSSSLKSCQLSFLSEKVRNQPISIREFCIIQLVRHIIPILTATDSVLDPCYIETLYNLIRIPSSLNYSTCMSIQNLLTTFYESIQLPVTLSPNYSRSLSFKLDLLSVVIHALISNVLENFQHNKILLFVLCRNESVLQQLLQLIEDLSQDAARNKPLAPSLKPDHTDFDLPAFHGHKSIIEHLDFDFNFLDNDVALVKLRPSWPVGVSLRSKQKLRQDSKLSQTWLGSRYAYALMKVIQIINSEFPSILKITKKEDLKRVLLHLKIFEPSLQKLIQPVVPLSLTRRSTSSNQYLTWDHYTWMQDEYVTYWFDYLLWSDIFDSISGKVYLSERDLDNGSISSAGNNTAGSGTATSRQSNRLERFNSNGSILSRTNTNDDIKSKNSLDYSSATNGGNVSGNGSSGNNNGGSGGNGGGWFKMPWSSNDDDSTSKVSNNNVHGNDNIDLYKNLLKPNIWTGTNVRLFPLVIDECESEFSFVDMTSSLLKRLRFNSTASINSMDTMQTLSNNYT